MAVSVTGPRAVNELGGPVIPGNLSPQVCVNLNKTIFLLNFDIHIQTIQSQKAVSAYYGRISIYLNI